MSSLTRVNFVDAKWSIDFENCDDVVANLPHAFQGWTLEVAQPGSKPPRAIVSRRNSAWHWQDLDGARPRDWDAIPPQSVMRVVTDVHDAALYWYLHENPQVLCIHGAAAKIGNGVICFPARGNSGKSILMACLAAENVAILGDDVIGLKSNKAFAMGFAPRLRTPLPKILHQKTAKHLQKHTSFEANGWQYLNAKPELSIKFKTGFPFTANVLPVRTSTGPATLTPARTADVLHAIIAENIIRVLPMETIFNRLLRFVTSHEKYVLTYSDPQDAAKLLLQRFS